MELDHNLLKMINEYVEEGDITGGISENDIMIAEIANPWCGRTGICIGC
jgi:hypothetical protein